MQIPTNDEISAAAKAVNTATGAEAIGTAILRRAWVNDRLFNEAERIAKWIHGRPPEDITGDIVGALALGMNVGMRIVEGRRKPESTAPTIPGTDAVEDQPTTEKARCA